MPTISMFFGIIVRMYCGRTEHNPPHIHVYYQDFKAVFEIGTGSMRDGDLPPRQTRLVEAWIELRREELIADWALASQGELPFRIEPLR
jgi:hypothetical protein